MPASRGAAVAVAATAAATADAAEIAVTTPTNNDNCNRNRGARGTGRVGPIRRLGARKARTGGGYVGPSDGSVTNGFSKCHRKRWASCPKK